jgi:hypothetical protein
MQALYDAAMPTALRGWHYWGYFSGLLICLPSAHCDDCTTTISGLWAIHGLNTTMQWISMDYFQGGGLVLALVLSFFISFSFLLYHDDHDH